MPGRRTETILDYCSRPACGLEPPDRATSAAPTIATQRFSLDTKAAASHSVGRPSDGFYSTRWMPIGSADDWYSDRPPQKIGAGGLAPLGQTNLLEGSLQHPSSHLPEMGRAP